MKQEWIERPEAGSALGYKLFSSFARLCGRSAARLVLYPITLYFLVRRGPERRASRDYLERVSGRPATPVAGGAAHSLLRRGRSSIARSCWPSASSASTSASTASTSCAAHGRSSSGVLMFGSHLGSFDALRVLAQFRPDVKVRVVIDVEQNPALSDFLNALNPELAQLDHQRRAATA